MYTPWTTPPTTKSVIFFGSIFRVSHLIEAHLPHGLNKQLRSPWYILSSQSIKIISGAWSSHQEKIKQKCSKNSMRWQWYDTVDGKSPAPGMYKTLQGIFTISTGDRLISEPSTVWVTESRAAAPAPTKALELGNCDANWQWKKCLTKKATSKFRSFFSAGSGESEKEKRGWKKNSATWMIPEEHSSKFRCKAKSNHNHKTSSIWPRGCKTHSLKPAQLSWMVASAAAAASVASVASAGTALDHSVDG